jgi:hypothetical protein
MTSLLLVPEEDDSGPARGQSDEIALQRGMSDAQRQSELRMFRISFDPQKVGFGILPWPGVDTTSVSRDSVAVAMKYLRDGVEEKNERESE